MALQIKNLICNLNTHNSISYKDFNFQPGITVVSGRSGSGKTTLFHLITKIKPYQGSIHWNKNNILTINQDYYYKKYISIVLQGGITSHHFSLSDYFYLLKIKIDQYEDFLKNLELYPLFHQPIHTLSGGQKYRIAIMIGIIKNTPLLLLDEPTAHLDALLTDKIIKLLESIQKNKVILIASHDRYFLENQHYSQYRID